MALQCQSWVLAEEKLEQATLKIESTQPTAGVRWSENGKGLLGRGIAVGNVSPWL